LAIGSSQRLADFKEVPTLAEALGQKDFTAGVWYGFLAPVGTPKDRLDIFYNEVVRASESKRMLAFMERSYMVPELLNSPAFVESLRRDVETSRKLVEDSRIKAR
jgi:tripartite-type tricarboxylate transporter receptor subunit TctC